jgi:hypothetical protein
MEGDVQELSIDEIVKEHEALASEDLLVFLKKLGPMKFSRVWALLLEPYMLRVTNVKDICVVLAKAGKLKNSWGGGNRKPRDEDLIELVVDPDHNTRTIHIIQSPGSGSNSTSGSKPMAA